MNELRPVAFAAIAVAAILSLAGCQRTVSGLNTRAEPLPAAPVDSVTGAPLDPAAPAPLPGGDQFASAGPVEGGELQPLDPLAGAPGGVDPANAPKITRESMAGTWTVASDSPDCRIILAFTKWSGGYRAATRRCTSTELTSVTAWDVKDNKVVLVDASGNQLASLYSTGVERYDGTTAGGSQVTFSR